MSSIFTKIINREIPAYILYENKNFISILDINPLTHGHSLVIPKVEIDYFFELDDISNINEFGSIVFFFGTLFYKKGDKMEKKFLFIL